MHILYGKEHSSEKHSSTLTVVFYVLVQVIHVLTVGKYHHYYTPLFNVWAQLSQTLIHHCKSLVQNNQNTLNTNTHVKLNKLLKLWGFLLIITKLKYWILSENICTKLLGYSAKCLILLNSKKPFHFPTGFTGKRKCIID